MTANAETNGAAGTSAAPSCDLADVLITDALRVRPSRPPDYEAEARALGELARELATNPRGLLQRVVDTAMDLCRADSAGISILEPGGKAGIFRWRAIAGSFAANLNGTMPREISPCGEVVSRNEILLFDRAERYFPALRGIEPPIYENLLAPWAVDGAPAGTLWIISHTPDRHFDAEDARLLASLAQFASIAWQTVSTLQEATAARAELERRTPLLEADLALLEEVFRRAPNFLFVLRGPDFVFELANEAFHRLVGNRELIGRPAFEALPETAGGGYQERITRVMATRDPFYGRELPVLVARTPGAPPEERFIDLVYLPLIDADGACTRVLGHGTDVTENVRARRAAEQEIQELNAGLELRVAERTEELAQAYDSSRANEVRYRTLFDSIDQGFCVIEVLFDREQRAVDYRFLEANPAFVEQTGLDDAVGRTMRELAPAHEPHWFDIYGKVALTGEPIRFEAPAEALDRWYDVYAFRIGEPRERKVAILFHDIAERKRMEAAIRETQKLESIGLLAAGIAHDFNNLLTAIMGNLSLGMNALSKTPMPALRPLLQDALTASGRAADLTRQLLAYAGKGRFVVGPLDFCALVRETARLFRASIPRQVEVRYDLPEHCPLIEADASQLQQLVMNLVINGAEAVGEQAGLVTLRVRLEDLGAEDLRRDFRDWDLGPGRYLRLEVEDTGTGMDAATRARIFDPFFTTKFQGRGLGLSAVHGIVRSHGGGLCVLSAPGSGTTFTVILPLLPGAAWAEILDEAAPEASASAPKAGIIAVVDDEEAVLSVSRLMLETEGYKVLTATNGRQAVELARRHGSTLSMMLLDLAMPIMGGAEAVPLIREIIPRLPIAMMTGFGDRDTLHRVRGLGVEVIEKPFRADQLAERVSAVLAGRNGESASEPA